MFMYVIPAIGITVSVHYCGGKISSLSLKFSDTHKCGCGNKKMKKNCCKDETKTFKIKDVQQHAASLFLNTSKAFEINKAIAFREISFFETISVSSNLYNTHHPPDKLKQPLYISNRILRV